MMAHEIQKKTIVANWKMHTTSSDARHLAEGIVDGLIDEDRVSIILCPPFPYLALVGEVLKDSRIALGAQNMYPEKDGAFTGEVSPTMLLDLGCKCVILGYSERRHKLGESDSFINEKVELALASGLDVILCVGETLEQRKASQTEGSVVPDDAAALLCRPGVDGALIGGASLIADEFLAIAQSAIAYTEALHV